GAGDTLFAHVYLDPKNPPKAIMLQWHTNTWRHRAYWGDNLISFGADNTDERRRLGPLPEVGKWARLEIPVKHVGLTPGITIVGWPVPQSGGTVYGDKAGINPQVPQSGGTYDPLSAWVRVQRATKGAGLPPAITAIVNTQREKRSPEQSKQLREHFVQHGW